MTMHGVNMDKNATIVGVFCCSVGAYSLIDYTLAMSTPDQKMAVWIGFAVGTLFSALGIGFLIAAYVEDKERSY